LTPSAFPAFSNSSRLVTTAPRELNAAGVVAALDAEVVDDRTDPARQRRITLPVVSVSERNRKNLPESEPKAAPRNRAATDAH
jgi:hypothetical protein